MYLYKHEQNNNVGNYSQCVSRFLYRSTFVPPKHRFSINIHVKRKTCMDLNVGSQYDMYIHSSNSHHSYKTKLFVAIVLETRTNRTMLTQIIIIIFNHNCVSALPVMCNCFSRRSYVYICFKRISEIIVSFYYLCI